MELNHIVSHLIEPEGWTMTLLQATHDLHVPVGLHPVAHGPQHGVGVGGINILVHSYHDLAYSLVESDHLMQGPPHVGLAGPAHLHYDKLSQIGQRLVHHHPQHGLDAARIPQMAGEHGLIARLLDRARLRWRHLADPRHPDGILTVGDGGDLHERVQLARMHVAVRLAEWPLRLQPLRGEQPFEDDLRLGWHLDVHRLAPHQANRLPGQPSGDAHLIYSVGYLLHGGVGHNRRGPHHQSCLQGLTPCLAFLPVDVDVLPGHGV